MVGVYALTKDDEFDDKYRNDELRIMRISQSNWKQMKILSIEYELSMDKVLTVLLQKMKEK